MESRSHVHEEAFDVSPEQMFELLITPSAIRGWWGAARAIVIPKQSGIWAASWGDDEDDPDYVTVGRIVDYDPPSLLVMKYDQYHAKEGQIPFSFTEDAKTVFKVRSEASGCVLTVEQTGFPLEAAADDFFAACKVGWQNTFAGIRKYLSQ